MTREETARALENADSRILLMVWALLDAQADITFYPLGQAELSFSPGQVKLAVKASLGRRVWRGEGHTT